MHKDRLVGVARYHGDGIHDISDFLGLSYNQTLSKINGKHEFTRDEIAALKSRYDLSPEDLVAIFFD